MNKADLMQRLREHPLYKAALSSVDPEQAKKISAMTEGFLATAFDGLIPLIAQASDPKKVEEARHILITDEFVSSGSQ